MGESMLMAPSSPRWLRRLHDERGFTLIEALVAMVTGMAVSLALFAILESAAHQSGRINDTAQASQLGRTTLTKMIEELHTACYAFEDPPILKASTPNKLVVENIESKKAEPEQARIDELTYDSTAKTLTDFRYENTGGEYPTYTYSGYPGKPTSKVWRAENVTETAAGKGLFSYYEYGSAATASTSEESETLKAIPLTALTTELGEANAAETAAIGINFSAGAVGKREATFKTAYALTVPFSTTVTLAFSAPNSEATIKDGPCQ
jgi:type II secretory pathway pseudopilin PulG